MCKQLLQRTTIYADVITGWLSITQVDRQTTTFFTEQMNYTRFLSKVSQLRQPSPIRYLIARSQGMFRLAGGLPNPDSFPIKAITLHMHDGSDVNMVDNDMIHALQYSNTEGILPMIEWVTQHQMLRHNMTGDDWDVIITTGSQDAMSKTFEMLIDPGAGDPILVENRMCFIFVILTCI
jgi:kynurenine/2-aminoadipate aminotransferase